jgi:hypothetical protein
MVVGTKDFKKSTKEFLKVQNYLAQICPIAITSLLNWLLLYGIKAILV